MQHRLLCSLYINKVEEFCYQLVWDLVTQVTLEDQGGGTPIYPVLQSSSSDKSKVKQKFAAH